MTNDLSLDWNRIDTVLLDMDGTLLDLHFDNHFWLEYVPGVLAARDGMTLDAARERFLSACHPIQGTLDWYCLDYWSEKLELDIPLLKEEVAHLIAEHPHVIEFLDAVRAGGRRAVLVTNAHHKSLNLKLRHTRLGGHLDAMISSHELGLAKEEPRFWASLQERENFTPERSLLIDDSLSVLASAQTYGIAHLLAVRRPDTRQPPRPDSAVFPMLESFLDIMPLPYAES